MKKTVTNVMESMIRLYAGDAARIQHFTKVYAYAALIGRAEHLDERTLEVLDLAALTHDIGIHVCEEKYGSCGGRLQEREGPALAAEMLARAGVAEDVAERVCFLIAHHHTYEGVDGLDWRILLEADFLVNGYEDGLDRQALESGYRSIFCTKVGKELCRATFGLAGCAR